MAIIIPSAKIYEIQNPKVRDNLIDRIEVSGKSVTPNNEYDTPVHNETIDLSDITFDWGDYQPIDMDNVDSYNDYGVNEVYDIQNTFTTATYRTVAAAVGLYPVYKRLYIGIPKHLYNKYVSSVYYGKDKDSNEKVGYRVVYRKHTGIVSIMLRRDGTAIDRVFSYDTNSDEQSGTLSEQLTISVEATNSYVGTAEAKIELKDQTVSVEGEVNNDNYYITFIVLCGLEKYSASTYNEGAYSDYETPFYVNGTAEKYEPINIEITVNGNTIGINLEDKTIYIPNESGNKPFSIEGNELMQVGNYIESGIKRPNAVNINFDRTLSAYKQGKETATIRCSLGEYYDEEGLKALSISETVTPLVENVDYVLDISLQNEFTFVLLNELKNNEFVIVKLSELFGENEIIIESGENNVSLGRNVIIKSVIKYTNYDPQKIRIKIPLEEGVDYDANLIQYIDGEEEMKLLVVSLSTPVPNGEYVEVKFVNAAYEEFTYHIEEGEEYTSLRYYETPPTVLSVNRVTNEYKDMYIDAPLPMTFRIYDKVIPMVYGADGKDKPMSLKNGKPKEFTVLGVKFSRKGALFQTLYLQEA